MEGAADVQVVWRHVAVDDDAGGGSRDGSGSSARGDADAGGGGPQAGSRMDGVSAVGMGGPPSALQRARGGQARRRGGGVAGSGAGHVPDADAHAGVDDDNDHVIGRCDGNASERPAVAAACLITA